VGEPPGPEIERCLGFVLDSWSAVRLVDHDLAGRQRLVRYLSGQLAARNVPEDLPVLLFTNAGGGYGTIETQLRMLETSLTAAGRAGGLRNRLRCNRYSRRPGPSSGHVQLLAG
jgi:hypothetical protein